MFPTLAALALFVFQGSGELPGPRFLDRGQPVLRPMPGADVEAALRALLQGPGASESAWTTAIPNGTTLLALRDRRGPVGAGLELTLSHAFFEIVGRAHRLELALEQIVRTVEGSSAARDVFVRVQHADGRVRDLDAWLGTRLQRLAIRRLDRDRRRASDRPRSAPRPGALRVHSAARRSQSRPATASTGTRHLGGPRKGL